MAKLGAPIYSLGAVGRFAKHLSLARRRRQNIIEATPVPEDAKTLAQLSWRHMYQKAVALWHALSAAEKQEWESLARPKHMTGFAWFISQALKPNPGLYLPLQGGTMAGNIDMAEFRILDLPDPTLIQEAATKAYVDFIAASLMWAKYLNDTPSGIGAYYKMSPTPTGEAKSTFTSGVLDTGDDQALFQWITDAEVTFGTIWAGLLDVHIHAERIVGNKSVQLYAEIYEYTTGAAEIPIATTEVCDFLTDDEACYHVHATLAADYEIDPTSKLLIKFYANVGVAGANVTINLYAEGDTASSISLPIPLSPLIEAFATFKGLKDTPESYAGEALKVPRVNAAENALEFATVVGGYTEGARVQHNTNQSIPNSTITYLAFNSERYDTDTIHDNAVNNSRLTCKTAGKYIIALHLWYEGHATGYRQAQIHLNRTTRIAHYTKAVPAGTFIFTIPLATIYNLAVNDYVEVLVYQTSGVALNVITYEEASPIFMIQRIG